MVLKSSIENFSITDQVIIILLESENKYNILKYDTKEKIGNALFDCNKKNVKFNLDNDYNTMDIKRRVGILLNYIVKDGSCCKLLLDYEKRIGKIIKNDEQIKYMDKKDKYFIINY